MSGCARHDSTRSGRGPVATLAGVSAEISPVPSEEEAVAIMAAVEALWPKPVVATPPETDRNPAWRFSGRWWHRDRFARTQRPWS
jgi:hypothetical protein